jgi:hypothetical protein
MSSNASRVVPVQMLRKNSIDNFNEQITNLLDEVEKRVENLRDSATTLEHEKEFLLDTLSSVNLNSELLRLGPGMDVRDCPLIQEVCHRRPR